MVLGAAIPGTRTQALIGLSSRVLHSLHYHLSSDSREIHPLCGWNLFDRIASCRLVRERSCHGLVNCEETLRHFVGITLPNFVMLIKLQRLAVQTVSQVSLLSFQAELYQQHHLWIALAPVTGQTHWL